MTQPQEPVHQISHHHIDFNRQYIGVAFLTQQQQAEIDQDSATGSLGTEESWDGIWSYIARAVNAALLDAHKQNRRYEHAEVCFWCSPSAQAEFGSSEFMVACGTRSTGTSMTLRRFHPAYEWKWIYTTSEQQRLIFDFYKAQLGRRYDAKASLKTFTNPRKRTTRSGWYCSELALSALSLLPEPAFHEHRSNCVETDDVYDIVCSSPLCNNTQTMVAPRQMQQMWGTQSKRAKNLQSWRDSIRNKKS